MRSALFLILVFLNSISSAQTHLVVHPDGHRGQIRSLVITADKKQIVTASFDKTILCWDVESGSVQREFRGEIGPGSEGQVYAIALSPDQKYLAAGGWFGKDDESEDLGDIRVYEFQSGKIAFVLKGHINVVHDLEFTEDSKSLISADANGDFWQWDLHSKTVVRKYNYNKEAEIFCIALSGNRFVSGDQAGHVLLWETGKTKALKKDKFFEGYSIRDVAISDDGNWIAASGEMFILIYDKNLNRIAEIDNEEGAAFLQFSPDSRKLLSGSTTTGELHHVNVFEYDGKAWNHKGSFDDHRSSVICGGFLDNETCVSAGGEQDEVCIWKLSGKKSVLLRKMNGVGQSGFAASMNEKKIFFASRWTANFGMSEFDKCFDLLSRQWITTDELSGQSRPVTKKGEYKLERERSGSELENLNSKLLIIKNNRIVDSVVRHYWDGSRHNVFSFISEKYFVSGGSYGIMTAHDLDGNMVSRFVGHEGDIWGLSVSPEHNRLITVSSDQTIRIWDLKNVAQFIQPDNMPSVWKYCEDMQVAETFHKVFKMIGVESSAKKSDRGGWNETINALKRNGYPCSFLENKLADLTANFIYPVASLFLTNTGEWIIWNNDGYFTSSRKGAKYVGYHVNQGQDKEAKFYPFEQFDLKFNRPDIILQDLSLAPKNIIDAYYYAYKKRLKKMGITEEQLNSDIHIPEIEITGYTVKSSSVLVRVKMKDEKYRLNQLIVYVNDVPVGGRKGTNLSANNSKDMEDSFEIDLGPGRNKIQVSVINQKGAESFKETFYVTNNSDELPDLYLVSIGVSEYKDKNYNLRYAAKDAKDVTNSFANSKIFKNIYVRELINEKVTAENIRNMKNNFLMNSNAGDVVMVFTAGHGLLDKNLDYYFAASDVNFMDPSQGGIPYDELENMLDGIPALRKLLFMDSCHSGELEKDETEVKIPEQTSGGNIVFRQAGPVSATRKAGVDNAGLLSKDLFSDLRRGTGAIVISSAGGVEFALESDEWKNGLFTYCLLNGINENKADLDKNGKIFISELQQYIHDEVYRLSDGRQEPAFRRENLEFDFRVW